MPGSHVYMILYPGALEEAFVKTECHLWLPPLQSSPRPKPCYRRKRRNMQWWCSISSHKVHALIVKLWRKIHSSLLMSATNCCHWWSPSLCPDDNLTSALDHDNHLEIDHFEKLSQFFVTTIGCELFKCRALIMTQ